MSQVLFNSSAAHDIQEIWLWVAQGDPANADRVAAGLHEKMKNLARYPKSGRERPEFGEGLRSFPIARYLVFYREIPEGVRIYRVLHAARDIEALLG